MAGELVKLTLTLAQVDLITEHTVIDENLLAYNTLIKNEKVSIANNVKKVHLVYQQISEELAKIDIL